jgi:hypothetical protein
MEERVCVKLAVDLAAVNVHSTSQQGVTENVSPRGARVVTSRPWQLHEHVNVRSLLGTLRSRGRVIYCQPLAKGSYAIGLELFVKVGEWTAPRQTPSRAA